MKNWCKSSALSYIQAIVVSLQLFFLFPTSTICSAQTLMIPCDQGDSLTLVELYWSTNGPNWTNNTNWLISPVGDWYGVQLWADTAPGLPYRVVSLAMDYNNLSGTFPPLIENLSKLKSFGISHNSMTGAIPQSFSQLPLLQTLLFQDNHFTDPLPSFSSCTMLLNLFISNNDFHGVLTDTLLNHPYLNILLIDGNKFHSIAAKDSFPGNLALVRLQNNRLTFEDILPYKQPTGSLQYNCTYFPQDSVLLEIDSTIIVGSNLLLDSWVDTCQDNKYQWKKNGVFLTPFPVGNCQYIKQNIQFADSGYYTCDVTNWHADYLTLHRHMIHVRVVDSTVNIPVIVKPEIEINYNLSQAFLDININQKSAQGVSCYLYDMTGRQVLRLYQGVAREEKLHYYMKEMNLNKGVYIVKLTTHDKLIVKKIIIP